MNIHKTNYKTVIKVTEDGQPSFCLDLNQERDQLKATVMNRVGIEGTEYGGEFLVAMKETKTASYSSEYELMMDVYWTVSKALITEKSGSNIINKFEVSVGKALTNDNFKVILVNIDLVK